MGTASGGIAPVKYGTHAKLGDGMGKLRLPDGRMLDGLSGGEIARALLKLGVPVLATRTGA